VIDRVTAPPLKKNPYRIPYALRYEMKMQIEEMVWRGILTKAATEWAAPVILIRKKSSNGTRKYLICTDYRGLNAVRRVLVFACYLSKKIWADAMATDTHICQLTVKRCLGRTTEI
jgi:hypothetical protein